MTASSWFSRSGLVERLRIAARFIFSVRPDQMPMDVISSLEELKSLLPGDTPAKLDGEYCFEHFDHFVDYDEPELALHAIVYIAEAHRDNGTPINGEVWIKAKRIALYLMEQNQMTTYSETVVESLRTIDGFLRPKGG